MAGEERNIKVKIDGVRKVFNGRSGEMVALNGINMDILDNEFVCVVGPSGCGKSTLLNIIAGLYSALEKAMAPHSSTLAWKIPWTEEPGGL